MMEVKKLKLNIRGNFQKFWNKMFLKKRISKMGVNVHDIKDIAVDHVEITVSGEKRHLWDVIKWSKKPEIFFVLNDVAFEFVDIEVTS